MSTVIPQIKFPELFFGFVAPIGADIKETLAAFHRFFGSNGYRVIEIKVTDIFPVISKYVSPKVTLKHTPVFDRYSTYIKYGDQLRDHFTDDAFLAVATIGRIMRQRNRLTQDAPFTRTVFLLHQFKRKEEIDLLRSIYGRLFFQVSIYSRRGARVDSLARLFSHSAFTFDSSNYRPNSEDIVQTDENEMSDTHGQRVAKIFHDADFIVNTEADDSSTEQVLRFCDLLFGSNKISPTRHEYGLFMAKAAALRTLDLSRQVGAAIFSRTGEILALGSNEVPKAGGGTYWCDKVYDDRDYARGVDTNDERKRENLADLLKRAGKSEQEIETALANKSIRELQLMDALEYGRVVHAEMAALTDAARLGIPVKNGTLYCTTFPCHMCAKHIVAAGLARVVFLEPYPKSLAFDLHADAIQVESGDRGRYQRYPAITFDHFYGISPRRYRELFERGRRKDDDGKFLEYVLGVKRPNLDYKYPAYNELEKDIMVDSAEVLKQVVTETDSDAAPKPTS